MIKDDRVKEYLPPKKIIISEGITNAEALLINRTIQAAFYCSQTADINGKAYIILDFGREICGGLRIITQTGTLFNQDNFVRIRLGESLSETCVELDYKNATNQHGLRDMKVTLPRLSDLEFGSSGFRFARIDFPDNTVYKIQNIYAASVYRDIPYIGSFECSDSLINDIYNTARYTLLLNMQTMLWDGIKRDRLVWAGDLHPEVMGITCIWGQDKYVEEALLLCEQTTPLDGWMMNIPSYSAWWIKTLCDYYQAVGNDEFVKQRLPYLMALLKQINGCIDINGEMRFDIVTNKQIQQFFLDWQTYNTEEAQYGVRYLFISAIKDCQKLLEYLKEDYSLCQNIILKLLAAKDKNSTKKQIIAFKSIAGLVDPAKAAEKLAENGASGLSSFMSGYILQKMFDGGKKRESLDILKQYFGAMLQRGATTFWEDFDVEWLNGSGSIDKFPSNGQKDIHGDYGAHCYKGYRHSLCHGWSCGAVHFLTRSVLGINFERYGCRKVTIKPFLGDMKYAKGKFPTPYGIIEIEHALKNGKVCTKYKAPKGVKIILKKD